MSDLQNIEIKLRNEFKAEVGLLRASNSETNKEIRGLTAQISAMVSRMDVMINEQRHNSGRIDKLETSVNAQQKDIQSIKEFNASIKPDIETVRATRKDVLKWVLAIVLGAAVSAAAFKIKG